MKTITQVEIIHNFNIDFLQERINRFCQNKEVKDIKVINANTIMIVYEIII